MQTEDDAAVLRFVQIPVEILQRSDISLLGKLIFGVIYTRENGKNGAWPSQKSLMKTLGVSTLRTLQRAIDELEEKGFLKVKQRGLRRSNLYFSDVTPVSHQEATPMSHQDVTWVSHPIGKEQYKKTNESPTPLPSPSTQGTGNALAAPSGAVEGVNELFKVFYETVNPGIKFGNKTVRKDAEWLIQKYGLSEVLRLAKWACSIQGQPYAPTIGTPSNLREKLPALQAFAKRNSESKVITI